MIIKCPRCKRHHSFWIGCDGFMAAKDRMKLQSEIIQYLINDCNQAFMRKLAANRDYGKFGEA